MGQKMSAKVLVIRKMDDGTLQVRARKDRRSPVIVEDWANDAKDVREILLNARGKLGWPEKPGAYSEVLTASSDGGGEA